MVPTVLILASGPGIGKQCVLKFLSAGFNVVSTSRSVTDSLKASNLLELHLDLSNTESIPGVFDKARKFFDHPTVVIYNGASRTLGSAKDPLSALSLEQINYDTAVNIHGALIAAREAVLGWNEYGIAPATFIYTGNKQNIMSDPKALTFGMAKTAAAKMMWDCSKAYYDRAFRFYFTDQRNPDGSPAREAMDPEARANLYVELALDDQARPWHYTFTTQDGYVNFGTVDRAWDVEE